MKTKVFKLVLFVICLFTVTNVYAQISENQQFDVDYYFGTYQVKITQKQKSKIISGEDFTSVDLSHHTSSPTYETRYVHLWIINQKGNKTDISKQYFVILPDSKNKYIYTAKFLDILDSLNIVKKDTITTYVAPVKEDDYVCYFVGLYRTTMPSHYILYPKLEDLYSNGYVHNGSSYSIDCSVELLTNKKYFTLEYPSANYMMNLIFKMVSSNNKKCNKNVDDLLSFNNYIFDDSEIINEVIPRVNKKFKSVFEEQKQELIEKGIKDFESREETRKQRVNDSIREIRRIEQEKEFLNKPFIDAKNLWTNKTEAYFVADVPNQGSKVNISKHFLFHGNKVVLHTEWKQLVKGTWYSYSKNSVLRGTWKKIAPNKIVITFKNGKKLTCTYRKTKDQYMHNKLIISDIGTAIEGYPSVNRRRTDLWDNHDTLLSEYFGISY